MYIRVRKLTNINIKSIDSKNQKENLLNSNYNFFYFEANIIKDVGKYLKCVLK